jgi:hypothetical protein
MIVCGHAEEGKLHSNYQALCHTFAQHKCAALIVDPIHQGERMQLRNPGKHDLCDTHNIINRHLKSIGDYFGSWRVWDGIRAMDYLCSRPEIDTAKIGITGNSGGGTMTTLVNACEERFAAAAPSCYITRWQRNVENELPVDAEQIPPAFAANGGEMADLLLAAAPRPLLILGQKDDFFDIRGTGEVYQEIRRIYELLGYADRVRFFAGPCGHGLSVHNRNEIYKFYAEYLDMLPGDETGYTKISPAELACLPSGKLHGKLISDIIADDACRMTAERPLLNDDELKAALCSLLQIGDITLPYYRQLRPAMYEALKYQNANEAIDAEVFDILIDGITFDLGRVVHGIFDTATDNKYQASPIFLFRDRITNNDTGFYSAIKSHKSTIDSRLSSLNQMAAKD